MNRKLIFCTFVLIFFLPLLFTHWTISLKSSDAYPSFGWASTTAISNGSAFAPIIANVQVLYPNSTPMSGVVVVAINHEYLFRYDKQTNETGWAIFRTVPGKWSFFLHIHIG